MSILNDSSIVLLGPPETTELNRTVTTSTSLSVTWQLVGSGGFPPVQFFIWIKRSENSRFSLWSDEHLTYVEEEEFVEQIMNLTSATSYDVIVEAKNNHPTHNAQNTSLTASTFGENLLIFGK